MRLVRLSLAVAFVLSVSPAAAADDVVWSRHVRGYLADVTTAPDGSVYVAGEGRWADHWWTSMLAARYGPAGALAWQDLWRPDDRFLARGSSIVSAPGGGVYVGGTVGRRATSESSPRLFPVIHRYSSSGRVVWKAKLPLPPEATVGVVVGLAADHRGVVAAVDTMASMNYGGVFHDGALWAFGPTGTLRWMRDFETPGITGTFDAVGDVTIGPNGLVYAVGHVDLTHRDTMEDPPSDEDIVIQQMTRRGALRWSRMLSDGSTKDRDHAVSVAVRPGLVVVGGWLDSRLAILVDLTADRSRAWVGAFGTDGTPRWSHRWGDQKPARETISVAIAPWGPVYVASIRWGAHRTDPMSTLRRYSSDGTLVEERTCDGAIQGVATSDDAVYLTTDDRLERWRR